MTPQMWPRLIDALRLTLGPAWLFLIAAEAIASTDGLGFQIFLVRRYLAMDVILPTWLGSHCSPSPWTGFLQQCRTRLFAWAEPGR